MSQQLFKDQQQPTEAELFYIMQEAESLSAREDHSIDNYADREINNPDLDEYIKDDAYVSSEGNDPLGADLEINLNQEVSFMKYRDADVRLRRRFRKIKEKIKSAFCSVAQFLVGSDSFDWKELIKNGILAATAALGFVFPVAFLPLAIAILAKLLKRGVNALCPA